jgi:hypothetical protein
LYSSNPTDTEGFAVNIVMISPGFPLEQAYFTRALAQTGAQVIGVGDQPVRCPARGRPASPPRALRARRPRRRVAVLAALDGLSAYVHGSTGSNACGSRMSFWRHAFASTSALPGMSVEQANWFRDKEQMKLVLDRAGIRTPRHASAGNAAEIWEAAEQIGYPLIIKPIAGAGSADTYRVDNAEQLATKSRR